MLNLIPYKHKLNNLSAWITIGLILPSPLLAVQKDQCLKQAKAEALKSLPLHILAKSDQIQAKFKQIELKKLKAQTQYTIDLVVLQSYSISNEQGGEGGGSSINLRAYVNLTDKCKIKSPTLFEQEVGANFGAPPHPGVHSLIIKQSLPQNDGR